MHFQEGEYVFHSNKTKVHSDIKDNDMKQNATSRAWVFGLGFFV